MVSVWRTKDSEEKGADSTVSRSKGKRSNPADGANGTVYVPLNGLGLVQFSLHLSISQTTLGG